MHKQYGTSCDIFSVGVILFNLLNGYPPFKRTNNNDNIFKYIQNYDFKKFWEIHKKCKIYHNLSARDLFEQMIKYNQNDRITLINIKKHNWYRNTKYLKGNQLKNSLIKPYNQMKKLKKMI